MRNPTKSITPPLDFRFLDLLIILLLSMGAVVLIFFILGIGKDIIYDLKIKTSIIPDAIQHHPFKEQLFAIGGREPYLWTGQDLPPGIEVTQDGLLMGIPESYGDFTIHLSVRDNSGEPKQDSKTLNFRIIESKETSKLEIKTQSLPPGFVQTKYEMALAAEGGVRPYRWSFYNLPKGLVGIDEKIAGMPEKEEVTTVTIKLEDASLQTTTKELNLQILPAIGITTDRLEPLEISTTVPPAVAGIPYELQLNAKGGIPPYQWQILTKSSTIYLSIDGFLRLHEPGDWKEEWPIQVRVFDSATQYTEGQIFPRIIRPTGLVEKIFLAVAAIGAWTLALLILWRFMSAKRIYFGEWDTNFTTILSILFLFTAVTIAFNAYIGTLFFIVSLIVLGMIVLFKYTY